MLTTCHGCQTHHRNAELQRGTIDGEDVYMCEERWMQFDECADSDEFFSFFGGDCGEGQYAPRPEGLANHAPLLSLVFGMDGSETLDERVAAIGGAS